MSPKADRRRVDRERVLAYRVAVHGLGGVPTHERGGRRTADAVVDTGLQDYPPTRTAWPALRLRQPNARTGRTYVFAHSVRAALHLHRAADLPLLRAALRIRDGAEFLPQHGGPFLREIEAAGIGFGPAVEAVAEAMRAVMADGAPRTKGELSGAVTGGLDRRITPWCEGCGVHHVHDATFRYATLQAGLVIEPESAAMFHYVVGPLPGHPEPSPEAARAELTRRFLRIHGPATPAQLGAWLALTPAAARSWWQPIAAELTEVDAAGRRAWVRTDLLPEYDAAPMPDGVRLLPPYDPYTALVDRELAVPDAAQRKQVWRAAGIPGVLLVDGEIAGTWRQRAKGGRLTLTVTTFGAAPAQRRGQADADAETIAAALGADAVIVDWG